jgi:hypothetical protein
LAANSGSDDVMPAWRASSLSAFCALSTARLDSVNDGGWTTSLMSWPQRS